MPDDQVLYPIEDAVEYIAQVGADDVFVQGGLQRSPKHDRVLSQQGGQPGRKVLPKQPVIDRPGQVRVFLQPRGEHVVPEVLKVESVLSGDELRFFRGDIDRTDVFLSQRRQQLRLEPGELRRTSQTGAYNEIDSFNRLRAEDDIGGG